jgi:hypothetical protein
MGLINYKDIDFNKSINKENKIINFNGNEIQIVPYLSINDKYDLIMIALQKSFENNIYNSIKLEMYFKLNIIYMYTNLVINAEDRYNEEELFDTLSKSGFIDLVLENMNEKELSFLYSTLASLKEDYKEYNGSFVGVMNVALTEIPKKLTTILELVELKNPGTLQILKDTLDSFKNNAMASQDQVDAEEE